MSIATTPEQLEQFLREGGGAETMSGEYVTPRTAMGIAAVYRCVTLISGAVATMPLHLKRRVDERTRQDASDHPLWEVLRRRPNRWQTPSQFRRQIQSQALFRGMGYAMKVRSGKSVVALIPLHPDRVRTEQIADYSLEHVYTRTDGSQITIPQRDMFNLVGMSLDGVRGLSVLTCARETIGAAIAMRSHGATLFRNGTSLGGVLKHPGKLGTDGQETLRASLEAYRGTENAGKNLILEEGMAYERLGMSNADAEFIASRAFEDKHIYMFFGVPPHMAGDTTGSTSWGSGIEMQTLGFQAYTLEDWLTTWEETITRDCLDGEDPKLFPWFNRAAAVKNDIKTRTASYSAGRAGGWLSKNDIRGFENMNPIEGGDDYDAPLNSNVKPDAAGDEDAANGSGGKDPDVPPKR
ncbi:phage portal protein [Sphingomonas sp. SRS2]|uniref:phage portal protein n=1 Tax=Sphingomonas sp. SRS2 TaxID=133190 RepID=UPI0009FD126E|nr:phage portal protein [Sphingomonas sp. SRS2]